MADFTQKIAALSSIDCSSFSDEAARRKALTEARELVQRLESPWDKLTGVIWVAQARHGIVLTGTEIGLFDTLEKVPSGASLDELVEMLPVKVEKALLHRILNLLTNTGDVRAIDDKYGPTTFSTSIATTPGFKAAVLRSVDTTTACTHLPTYLKKIGYKDPADSKHGNHYDTFGMDMFTRLKEIPERGKQFNEFMTATSAMNRMPPWWTNYPFDEKLLNGYDPNKGPLVVDVGGGVGTLLERFRENLPEPHKSTVSLVFQDVSNVITHAKTRPLPPNLHAMSHDFFKPQPIQGARAYFMRAILHDWPDADCLIILGHLRKAMIPGYSKLLIDDRVVPAKGVDLMAAVSDIVMMVNLDAKERTEENWRSLFEEAGFKLCKIYEGPRAVLELEVVD
ncbi:2-oxo-Delta(3)-4-5-5-trimethylcyclopentenylacetyl-CoA monooxygenase [Venturia nashicola]|uniref:2-oxo-Delta(3)-4-5-5-trimethylcyclopentenylacetyl-CoA monooxygenase n=1 Tax=Venturia nashicola TaxID=86259 RepID=A0A4Z1PMB0_9PEZI|nr:2-oxo-Delta(3)-4-5-5-trimethylcyclopentenylacetyl-CoA monooxygenase [Venturia nashicola]